jgi:transposase
MLEFKIASSTHFDVPFSIETGLSDLGVLHSQWKRIFGIDLTKIPGIRVGIAQNLFGEIGPDCSKFRSASAFASWMGLCPDNDISGGKVLRVGTRKVNCRAARALRKRLACPLRAAEAVRGDCKAGSMLISHSNSALCRIDFDGRAERNLGSSARARQL